MEVKGLVAKTILHQLGGSGKLVAMLGARSFILGEDSLSFRLPSNFAKNGINQISIRLKWNDLYIVTFGRSRAGKYKPLREFDDVYAEVLKTLIEQETGLYLSL